MLKPYAELRQVDVTPFVDKRHGADYLPYNKCIDLSEYSVNSISRVYRASAMGLSSNSENGCNIGRLISKHPMTIHVKLKVGQCISRNGKKIRGLLSVLKHGLYSSRNSNAVDINTVIYVA